MIPGLLLVFLFSSFGGADVRAALSESACPSIDYSHHFQKLKDQDGNGLCWAFTATELLEEQLCLDDPRTCADGTSALSVLDVSRSGWSVSSGRFGGGKAIRALDAALSGGACRDHDAPFIEGTSLSCDIIGFFNGGDQPCLVSKLDDIFAKWKARTAGMSGADGSACSQGEEAALFGIYQKAFQPDLKKFLARQGELGVDFFKALRESRSRIEFLEKVLLTPNCRESRLRFGKFGRALAGQSHYLHNKPTGEVAETLARALATGHSAALSFCVGGTFWPSFKACPSDEKALLKVPTHAIVVDGMRFNADKKRCEIRVRNSWGSSSSFNGWYGLEKAAPSFVDVAYIEERK